MSEPATTPAPPRFPWNRRGSRERAAVLRFLKLAMQCGDDVTPLVARIDWGPERYSFEELSGGRKPEDI